jgi:acetyl esterase/lipase
MTAVLSASAYMSLLSRRGEFWLIPVAGGAPTCGRLNLPGIQSTPPLGGIVESQSHELVAGSPVLLGHRCRYRRAQCWQSTERRRVAADPPQTRWAAASPRAGLGWRPPAGLLTPPVPGRHPLVIYLPGGGFVVAPRAMARPERGFIAAAGYAVASVAYRTTRQHATYADALADIQSAIGHLIGHAAQYGIDRTRSPSGVSPRAATSPH